jgi:hypothetical protein
VDAYETKKSVLELIDSTQSDLQELLNSLTPEERKTKGNLKKWSVKDMISHLNFWGQHFLRQLNKSAKGEKVPLSGDYLDQVNDGVLYEHMDQTLEDALAEYEKIHQELMGVYRSFPAEDMSEPKKYSWLEGRPMSDRILGNLVWHPQSHIADFYVKRGQLDKATALQEALTEKLKGFPTWGANAVYNAACFYALNGMAEKAIACLKTAFAQRPDLIEWSKQDSDLDSLRGLPEFKNLFSK